MNGRRAKALRKFAARVAQAGGAPLLDYEVIEHKRRYNAPPITPEEIERCEMTGETTVTRIVSSFQIVMKDCARKLYKYAKRHYKNAPSA